jgi:hypothetical protein
LKIEKVRSLSMRGLARFVSMLVFAGLLGTSVVQAQTEKTVRGKHGLTPYISRAEFLAATVTRGKQKNVSLEKILTLSSLDTLIQYLGRPEEMSTDSPFGASVLAYVNYEGAELEYVKAKGADYKLRELKIRSPEWGITVNGTRLQPGSDASSLSKSVRRVGHMLIAAPGAAQKAKLHGELEVMEGSSSIQVDVDEKSQQISEVWFHRILSERV